MSDLDIPDGPKTPKSVRRVAILAIIFVFVILYGDVLEIPFLSGMGKFALDNLFLMGSIVGITLFLYTNRNIIASLLENR